MSEPSVASSVKAFNAWYDAWRDRYTGHGQVNQIREIAWMAFWAGCVRCHGLVSPPPASSQGVEPEENERLEGALLALDAVQAVITKLRVKLLEPRDDDTTPLKGAPGIGRSHP
jgi:hypothetical protein